MQLHGPLPTPNQPANVPQGAPQQIQGPHISWGRKSAVPSWSTWSRWSALLQPQHLPRLMKHRSSQELGVLPKHCCCSGQPSPHPWERSSGFLTRGGGSPYQARGRPTQQVPWPLPARPQASAPRPTACGLGGPSPAASGSLSAARGQGERRPTARNSSTVTLLPKSL